MPSEPPEFGGPAEPQRTFRRMGPNDVLPRLLRLHGTVARTAPNENVALTGADAVALTEAYNSIRKSAHGLCEALGIPGQEFDTEFPELEMPTDAFGSTTPRALLRGAGNAATAAVRLRSLRGYLDGLVIMTALTSDLTPEQIKLVQQVVTS